MSDLLNSLKGLKDKLNTIESNIDSVTNNTEVPRKPVSERLQEKYDELVKLQNNQIAISAGGNFEIQVTSDLIKNCPLPNILQDELQNYCGTEPIFVDMSENYLIPIIDIMRRYTSVGDKMLTVQLQTADKDHLVEEIKLFFKADQDKIIDKCDFVYSSRLEEYRKQIEEERKKKEFLAKHWDASSPIQCWSCGTTNNGNFWKHKYHSQREDSYCIGGYYGTCKSCDPSGTYQA